MHFTHLYISTLIENRVGDDGMPAILKYRPSDLYLTDRKPTMTILQKIPAPLSTFTDKALTRAPPYVSIPTTFFSNKSNSVAPPAARPAEHASSPPSSPTESFIGVGVEKKLSW